MSAPFLETKKFLVARVEEQLIPSIAAAQASIVLGTISAPLSKGTGLEVDITTTLDVITSVIPHAGNAGTGYAVGDYVLVGSGGYNGLLKVLTITPSTGAVLTLSVINGGFDYPSGTTTSSVETDPMAAFMMSVIGSGSMTPQMFVLQDPDYTEQVSLYAITVASGVYSVIVGTRAVPVNTVNAYNAPYASILTPGIKQAFAAADFNARLRALTMAPAIAPDSEAEKFATGDHRKDFSIMGVRSGVLGFSDKIAVNKSSGSGCKLSYFVATAGAITGLGGSPTAAGTGYKAGDLLSVSQTNNHGTGLKVDYTGAAGAITSPSVNGGNGGTGYVTGDLVLVAGGLGGILVVTAAGGVAQSLAILTGYAGTTYPTGAQTGIATSTPTSGTGGVVKVLTVVSATGAIASLDTTPVVAGTGYYTDSHVAGVSTTLKYQSLPVWSKFCRGQGRIIHFYTNKGIGLRDVAAADQVTLTLGMCYVQGGGAPVGEMYTFAGCAGTGGPEADGLGKPWTLKGSMTGKFVEAINLTNAQILAMTGMETALPEKMLSNAIQTTDNDTAVVVPVRVSKFSYDFGCKVSPVGNQADDTGYDYFMITDRDPKITFDPLLKPISEEDIITNVKDEHSFDITIQSAISSPNITIEGPRGQLMMPTFGAKEGQVDTARTYRLLGNELGSGAAQALLPDECSGEILLWARS